MTSNLLINPIFWLIFYLAGYAIAILMLAIFGIERIKDKIPQWFLRAFIFLVFVLPPLVMPFMDGPKTVIPPIIALFIGAVFTGAGLIIRIVAQREIGVSPALKGRAKLVTTGIYAHVRNPLYLSNGLFAIGLALLFDSLYAFLFSILYTLLYLPIIYLEEKDLLRKYGKEYEEYRKKVRWVLIPGIF